MSNEELHSIQLEIDALKWEEWMLSITSSCSDRIREIRDRLAILECEARFQH